MKNNASAAPVPRSLHKFSPSRKITIALLTLVAFAIMIAWAGPTRLAQVFSSFGWRGILWLFAVYQVSQLLRALRLQGALPAGTRPPWLSLLGIVSLHQFLNHVMPVRLGELSLPLLLRRFSAVNTPAGFAALVVVRLQEIFVLTLVFLVAVTSLGGAILGGSRTAWILVGTACTLGLLLTRIGLPWLLHRVHHAIERRPNRALWLARSGQLVRKLQENLEIPVTWPRRLWFFLLTVAIWLNTFFFFHETLRLNGIPLSFVQTIAGSAFANFTQTLPINTFGSFGSMEAGWTLGFSLIGINSSTALATGLAMHVLVVGFLGVSATISWLALNLTVKTKA